MEIDYIYSPSNVDSYTVKMACKNCGNHSYVRYDEAKQDLVFSSEPLLPVPPKKKKKKQGKKVKALLKAEWTLQQFADPSCWFTAHGGMPIWMGCVYTAPVELAQKALDAVRDVLFAEDYENDNQDKKP